MTYLDDGRETPANGPSGGELDFGQTSALYTPSRPKYPDRLYEWLRWVGIAAPGVRVADLCTGTGAFARPIARAGACVTGIDVCADMLSVALVETEREKLRIEFRAGTAEATGLPSAAFDACTVAQGWHWVRSRPAASEALRLLRSGGRLVIVHFDWLESPGGVVTPTEEAASRLPIDRPWRTVAGGTGIYLPWLGDLAAEGFTGIETFSFDVTVGVPDAEAWFRRLEASAIRAQLTADAFADFRRGLATSIAHLSWPQSVVHRLWCCSAARPLL